MKNCDCDTCKYCQGFMHSTRRGFQCYHPDQKHIFQYFESHKIQKMVGFIGFGENYSDVPKNKTTLKWCPMIIEPDKEAVG